MLIVEFQPYKRINITVSYVDLHNKEGLGENIIC